MGYVYCAMTREKVFSVAVIIKIEIEGLSFPT